MTVSSRQGNSRLKLMGETSPLRRSEEGENTSLFSKAKHEENNRNLLLVFMPIVKEGRDGGSAGVTFGSVCKRGEKIFPEDVKVDEVMVLTLTFRTVRRGIGRGELKITSVFILLVKGLTL